MKWSQEKQGNESENTAEKVFLDFLRKKFANILILRTIHSNIFIKKNTAIQAVFY
jgi:hypothetical protein